VVETFTVILEVVVENAPTAMRRNQLEGCASNRSQRYAEREGARLSAHYALNGFDRPDIPRADTQRV
jgi:hypothetical protein